MSEAPTRRRLAPEEAAHELPQDADGRRGERPQVEPHRAVRDPFQVVSELLRHRGLVAAPHLGEARQPRPDDEALPVRR